MRLAYQTTATVAGDKIIRRNNEVSTKGKGRNKSKGQMKERAPGDKRTREKADLERKGSRGVENGEEIAERERAEREA